MKGLATLLLLFGIELSFGQLASDSIALSFNDQHPYVQIPHIEAYDLDTNDFTFEAVIRHTTDNPTDYPCLLSNRTGHNDGFHFGLLSWSETDALAFEGVHYIRVATISLSNSSSDINLLDDQCHHIAITRRDRQLRFYVDGELDGYAHGKARSVTTDADLFIGLDLVTGTQWVGNLQEIRMWNVRRSDAEIKQYSKIRLKGDEPGLVGYWKLNEGTGQIVHDYSPYENHGVLGGGLDSSSWDPQWAHSCELIECTEETIISTTNETTCPHEEVYLEAKGDSSFIWTKLHPFPERIDNNQEVLETLLGQDTRITVTGETCGNSDTIDIEVLSKEECLEPEVYEVITANNDGSNDRFEIKHIEYYPENEVWIYDLLGNTVFHANSYSNYYSPENLNAGVYAFKVVIQELDQTFIGQLIVKK